MVMAREDLAFLEQRRLGAREFLPNIARLVSKIENA